jgi:hypothetical protein
MELPIETARSFRLTFFRKRTRTADLTFKEKLMADITRIEVTTKTGDAPFAGTDGGVYLALGGREFCLDIENHDDFERNQGDHFLPGMPYRPGHEHPGFRPVINARRMTRGPRT